MGSRLLATALLVLYGSISQGLEIKPTLINGLPADPSLWQEVVRIVSGSGACTATVVGPRAIVTAAHCAGPGAQARFRFNGKVYSATMNPSPRYRSQNHDVSVGIVAEDIQGAQPLAIGGTARPQEAITLLGYGCTNPGGSGGNDGILRIGKSVIIGLRGLDMISRLPNGAAVCFGDSGGPAFVQNGNDYLLLGINSRGNIEDTNFNTRLDTRLSQDFLRNVAQKHQVSLCGINSDCSKAEPQEPSCQLAASPSTIKANESLSLILTSQNAVSADIDGTPVNVPSGTLRPPTSQAGTFNATGTVRNSAGQTATCTATYTISPVLVPIEPPSGAPSCTLTAVPPQAQPNENISLELKASGEVTYASIDGNGVAFPVGKLNVSKKDKGDYSAVGFVRGPGGTANCYSQYQIIDGQAAPDVPEFSVTPSYCGSNRFPESGVQSACLGVVKYDPSWTTTQLADVILLTNTDNSLELLPIMARDGQSPEQLVVYGNDSSESNGVTLLTTRQATITKDASGLPLSMEGRSPIKGRLYWIQNLQLLQVKHHLPTL